jgi:hypothetical protein
MILSLPPSLSARYKGKYETGGIVPIIIVDDTERG